MKVEVIIDDKQLLQKNYKITKKSVVFLGLAVLGVVLFFANLIFNITEPFLPELLTIAGIDFFVCGIIGLIFNTYLAKICTLKTTVTALAISSVISLGIWCCMSYISCFFLTAPDKHPVRYPASVILGGICFIVFCVLVCFYVKFRKINRTVKGVIVDILLTIIYLPMFVVLFAVLDRNLAIIMHSYNIFG